MDVKFIVGVVIALLVGAACRYFNLPVPAPPSLLGVLLIAAISAGYILTDKFLPKNEATATQIEINK
jgi:XapX domain-containing protein